ncbi:MAG TPA: aromatic amino acid transport family protein [Candidatus Portnoybacteria bacterium]|jgi:amino acid permease|nr:aromatic amino acid transport family protein [Candidatus Portnoybacteria bacterium]HOZ16421.1 aromatic amino acid transport family protein [Candidatus Portnoybacteria bacterium]HPH52147.1 aromatic amino acid transport family protein [Candidatus Portnoybacteria bacterium]HPJ80240.1 aromatic amino acid transport family protein [Candidatus Portnoybacteria bacterium]HPM28481.1 aromatic amino acid transport family protein [Candidatus Portnoybacteria bacterium]
MKKLLLAIFVLMSTIVGVGMFGLPYVGVSSGFLIMSGLLLLLTITMTVIHLFYADIVLKTNKNCRLPGYAEEYLGSKAKTIIGIFVILGFYGSLLVYIIVGGNFLGIILSQFINLPLIYFNLIFFAIGSVAIYFGLKLISGLDLLMGVFLIAIIFIFFVLGYGNIKLTNLTVVNWRNMLVPYGAILYSLAGMSVIPEIKEMFKKRNAQKQYKRAIVCGTAIPGIMYIIFIGIVIGLTGSQTTEEAIEGLANIIGEKAVLFGSLFGFLATITSFFALGLSLKQTYVYDFKIKKGTAWLLTCVVPIVLFMTGIHSFVAVITVIGAVMGLIECSAIILIHQKITGKKSWIKLLIVLMFIVGFVYTILNTI